MDVTDEEVFLLRCNILSNFKFKVEAALSLWLGDNSSTCIEKLSLRKPSDYGTRRIRAKRNSLNVAPKVNSLKVDSQSVATVYIRLLTIRRALTLLQVATPVPLYQRLQLQRHSLDSALYRVVLPWYCRHLQRKRSFQEEITQPVLPG